MKHHLITLFVLLVGTNALAVVPPGEYYIQSDYFGKLLSIDSDSKVALMPYSSGEDANYLFEAIAADGNYVKLRHKASGKYVAASTSNTWSVVATGEGSGDHYLWAFDAKFSIAIVSKKNTGCRLGCDYSTSDNVPVYYDKKAGGLNWFSVVPANGQGFAASIASHHTDSYTNDYGVTQRDAYRVSSPTEVSGEDLHIVSATPFAQAGTVNLSGDHAWLVFDSIRPSKVLSTYLGKVTIDGAKAIDGQNCRVGIWLTGAVVMPATDDKPFTGYSANGESCGLTMANHTTLGDFGNEMHSFTLKRGYMATLATKENGEGYSRVYVADHADLTVTLPTALDRRVSSVNIRNWHYVGKRGYGDGNTGNNLACNSTWHWNWAADKTTSRDLEYIPIKQHRYWPSNEQINQRNSTALMLINEPDHSEQHTSDKCSCGGTTDEWTAYTITPQFNYTGMRIGSPSATDAGWLKNYRDHCYNMAQRLDFICTHGYWSGSWTERINDIWNKTKAPIWITEWEYGSSWDSYKPSGEDEYAQHVLDVLDILEYDNRIERYAYYGVDGGGTNGWMRLMFYDYNASKGCTKAGNVYKRVKTHFAYDASRQAALNWWKPSVEVPAIDEIAELPDGGYTLSITNGNGDVTESIGVQMQDDDGTWTDICTVEQRSLLENTQLSITLPADRMPDETSLRLLVKTIYGDAVQSAAVRFSQFLLTHEYRRFSFDQGSYTPDVIVTYAKDITGSSPLAQMQPVEGWEIAENGDGRASAMKRWGNAGIGGAEYAMPATDSQGSPTGGGIGLVAVWTATAQYTHSIELPAGKYAITVPVYNIGNGTGIEKNLVGFVASDGTEYLSTVTSYPVGKWTKETIYLSFDEPVSGYLSLGYKAKNIGSGSAPHLAYDYVLVMGGPSDSPVAIDGNYNATALYDVYTPSGICLKRRATMWALRTLPHGIYLLRDNNGCTIKIKR